MRAVTGCGSPEAGYRISDSEKCWGRDWLPYPEHSAEKKTLGAHLVTR
ncbi:hypothetical protein ACF08M_21360 [Streptomyces sp. NPDC015032]